MPYELQALYQTVPTDPDRCWGTSVTLVDPETDDAGIVFRCAGDDAPDESFHIDVEEWPLIVQAVEKLLANSKKPEIIYMTPAVADQFLKQIDFSLYHAREVLAGKVSSLDDSFLWDETSQGRTYWESRCHGQAILSDEDKALIKSWADAAEYHQESND
jgi:hypothetical protein